MASMLCAQSDWAERLKTYTFGQGMAGWAEIDKQLRSSVSRERKAAEESMVDVLLARDATPDSRMMACRRLRFATLAETNAALISLLSDPRVADDARMALEAKPGDEIDAAFRRHLPLASDALKAGLLSSIARRGDLEAVELVGELARSTKSPQLRIQAIRTVGRLGGESALNQLLRIMNEKLEVSSASSTFGIEIVKNNETHPAVVERKTLQHELRLAMLTATRRLLERNDFKYAGTKSGWISTFDIPWATFPNHIRIGFTIELARHEPSRRWGELTRALTDDSGLLQAVPSLLELLEDERRKDVYGTFFDPLPTPAKVLLLGHWRPQDGHEDKLRALSIDTAVPPELREAALRVLNRRP